MWLATETSARGIRGALEKMSLQLVEEAEALEKERGLWRKAVELHQDVIRRALIWINT
jgi:hypothetical protein